MEKNTSKVLGEAAVSPLDEVPSDRHQAGAPLFVINLCASMAPIVAAGRTLKGLEGCRLYQVTRVEDGRTRYRLRLGFFTSEAEVEVVLATVREQYPTAFVACLYDEDRRFARGYVAPENVSTPRPMTPVGVDTSPVTTQPPAKPAQVTAVTPKARAPQAVDKPAPVAAKSAPPIKAREVPVIELTLAAELSALAPAPERQGETQPFHVGRGIEIPDLSFSLSDAVSSSPATVSTLPGKRAVATVASAAPKPAMPARTASSTVATPAKSLNADLPLPDLDSTQTIRALTSCELSDENQEKWFAIELAVSEQPVNLDTMPHLDIFEAYRLYSVASVGGGKILHSLRLGFFREEVSAQAVGGYLKTFFPTASAMRISVAEQWRFKDPPAPKKVMQEMKGEAKVIELNEARGRASRPAIPTVTLEVPHPKAKGFNPGATGAFKAGSTGAFRTDSTGSQKTLVPTAVSKSVPSTARSERSMHQNASATGRHKAMSKKTLEERLLEEARELELSESAIRRLPKNNSLLSRLVGKLTNK